MITTKNGLLYLDGRELSGIEADAQARAQGFHYAEQLVKYLEHSVSKKPLLPSDTAPPKRALLPNDVTPEELWWLYHNHAGFHQFCDRLVVEAELAWQRHHNWEKKL